MSYSSYHTRQSPSFTVQDDHDDYFQQKHTLLSEHSLVNLPSTKMVHTTEDIPLSGLPTPPQPPPVARTLTNTFRLFLPDSIPCRLYILVIIIQTVIDLTIEGILVLKFNQASKLNQDLVVPSDRRLPVYFTIFGFAHVFQLVLAFDAVWMRNTLQFLFLAFFNLIVLVYAIVQIFEIRDTAFQQSLSDASNILDIPINVLTVVMPCVIATAEILYGILGYSIWLEFGWKVYKLLGADRRIKRMHVHYQILQCLMKFDVFFWVGFSIQLIWMVLQKTNVEYYVTVAALPASLIVLIAGHLGARHEHKPLMYAFMGSCIGASGYFAFKLFRIIQQHDLANIKPVFKTLVAFAVLAIIFLIATFTWSCIVFSNFGGGLKTHMSKNNDTTMRRPVERGSYFIGGTSAPTPGALKRLSLE